MAAREGARQVVYFRCVLWHPSSSSIIIFSASKRSQQILAASRLSSVAVDFEGALPKLHLYTGLFRARLPVGVAERCLSEHEGARLSRQEKRWLCA